MKNIENDLKSNRSSNIELYRAVVMLLIVAHHYVVNSGLTALMNENALSFNSLFLRVFGAFGKTGINCFVLITGYYMCTSSITFKKFSKLLFEVQLYKVVLYIVFLILGKAELSITRIILVLSPVNNITSNNFVSCYLAFYLFIPFINLLINKMNYKQHLLLVLLSVFVYTILGSVPVFDVTVSYISWFIILYLIASFIRLYPCDIYNNVKVWSTVFAVSMVLSIASVLVLTWWGAKNGSSGIGYYFVADSNKILAVTTGISGFMFFKNLKVKNSKFINILGGSTFGVLLCHTSSFVAKWLWKDFLKNTTLFESNMLVIHAISSVVLIFAVGTLVDVLRIRYVEKPFFKLWDKLYAKFIPWYKEKEAGILKKLYDVREVK